MEMMLSSLRDRLIERARRTREPISCTFEITPTCNLRCRFCYVALDPYKGPYLSTEQVCRVFDVLERAGVLFLTLTGGEIFSRRDFVEIYRYARSRGFLVTLFSNATMVSESIIDALRENPPFSIEVSVYGADAEHYEATTQIPGSFARFERGVTMLQSLGVPMSVKTPLSTITEDHIPALIAWAKTRGLPYKFDLAIDGRHDGGREPELYRIAPRRGHDLYGEIRELSGMSRDWSLPLPECGTQSGESASQLYKCVAGRTSFFIDGLGNASHCVIDREPAFPILDMPWEEIWSRIGDWVTQPLPEDAPCSGCGIRSTCGNCPARSRLATGNRFLKDTYFCDINHVDHGLEPIEHHPDYRELARRQLGACVA
jgi:radical SAM protein with 4Fe4S-binding SPASM domain